MMRVVTYKENFVARVEEATEQTHAVVARTGLGERDEELNALAVYEIVRMIEGNVPFTYEQLATMPNEELGALIEERAQQKIDALKTPGVEVDNSEFQLLLAMFISSIGQGLLVS